MAGIPSAAPGPTERAERPAEPPPKAVAALFALEAGAAHARRARPVGSRRVRGRKRRPARPAAREASLAGPAGAPPATRHHSAGRLLRSRPCRPPRMRGNSAPGCGGRGTACRRVDIPHAGLLRIPSRHSSRDQRPACTPPAACPLGGPHLHASRRHAWAVSPGSTIRPHVPGRSAAHPPFSGPPAASFAACHQKRPKGVRAARPDRAQTHACAQARTRTGGSCTRTAARGPRLQVPARPCVARRAVSALRDAPPPAGRSCPAARLRRPAGSRHSDPWACARPRATPLVTPYGTLQPACACAGTSGAVDPAAAGPPPPPYATRRIWGISARPQGVAAQPVPARSWR